MTVSHVVSEQPAVGKELQVEIFFTEVCVIYLIALIIRLMLRQYILILDLILQ
jgi:hypothetical protein